MLAAVKSLLTFAHTAGYLPFNPGRGLRLPAARGRLAERIRQVAVWGKGEKERVVLITAGTWRELAALRPADARPDAPVFRSRHGRPLSPSQAWRVVKAAAVRAGLEKAPAFSPHWLRHAHASHALDRGAPVSLVREGLGHASLVTTSRYTHARPGDGSSRYLPL